MRKSRLCSENGVARLIVLLTVAVIAVYACFAAAGYIQHLNDAKMTFDSEEVDEAKALAKHQYVLDGASGGITYYYDADGKKLTDASTYKGKINIAGYGRSDAKHNANAETGALGIPNKGDDGGAQFLAIVIDPAGNYSEAGGNVFENSEGLMISARWQGSYLTYYDYKLMTDAERSRLTSAQKDQIEKDRQKQLAATAQSAGN
jgi:hypothetical protein